MRHLAILFIHLIAILTQLHEPGGVRSLVAESLLLKHQILILNPFVASRFNSCGHVQTKTVVHAHISVVPILPFAVLAFCTFFVPDSSGTSGSSVLVGP
jgi:hypothetical protein